MCFSCFQASPERACLTPSSPADPSAQYFEGQWLRTGSWASRVPGVSIDSLMYAPQQQFCSSVSRFVPTWWQRCGPWLLLLHYQLQLLRLSSLHRKQLWRVSRPPGYAQAAPPHGQRQKRCIWLWLIIYEYAKCKVVLQKVNTCALMSLKQVEQFVSESFLKSLDDSLAELLEVWLLTDYRYLSNFHDIFLDAKICFLFLAVESWSSSLLQNL